MRRPSSYYFWPVPIDDEIYDGWEDFEPPWKPEINGTVFFICPKKHWDKEKHLYDGCVQSEVKMPKGFSECQEGCYEVALPIEKGRQLLIDYGFVENYIGPPWGKK